MSKVKKDSKLQDTQSYKMSKRPNNNSLELFIIFQKKFKHLSYPHRSRLLWNDIFKTGSSLKYRNALAFVFFQLTQLYFFLSPHFEVFLLGSILHCFCALGNFGCFFKIFIIGHFFWPFCIYSVWKNTDPYKIFNIFLSCWLFC